MRPESKMTDARTPSRAVTSFSLIYRGACSVCVATFLNEWSQQSARDQRLPWSGRGVQKTPIVRTLTRLREVTPTRWHCEVLLPPGWCEYLFLVDGGWMLDPNAPEKCPDGDGDFSSAKWISPATQLEMLPVEPARIVIRRIAKVGRESAA